MLQRPTTGDQLDNEYHEGNDQKQMNVRAQNVEPDKPEQPQNQQNYKDSPKHKNPFI
jgi:hypothetical protein